MQWSEGQISLIARIGASGLSVLFPVASSTPKSGSILRSPYPPDGKPGAKRYSPDLAIKRP